jgi:hypothetical protein
MLTTIAASFEPITFSTLVPSASSHEINGVQRGMGVYHGGSCVVGEGMGIGAPLALDGNRAVFPLDAEIRESGVHVMKRFHLNGYSWKFIGKARADTPYKWVRSRLAPLYMRSPSFRPIFSYLMAARTVLGMRSRYQREKSVGFVDIAYTLGDQRVQVDVDASHLQAQQFLVANELDGRLFDQMTLDDTVRIENIPPWLEVSGHSARIVAPSIGIGFQVRRVKGCRLFVGREVLANRLNWSGFSYMPKRGVRDFSYEVVFEK